MAAELGDTTKAMPERLDALDLDDVKRVVDKVVATYGTLDGMVNAARGGTREPKRVFADSEPEHWDLLINGIIKTTYNGCYAALPVMLEQGHGAIVNFSSAAGLRGTPPHLRQTKSVVYGATKAVVIAFTQALAQEGRDPGHPGQHHCSLPQRVQGQVRGRNDSDGGARRG